MSRSRDPHPLGKCDEDRLDLTMPGELKRSLAAVAHLHGKTATAWARDTLEKAIEGELAYMRRRLGGSNAGRPSEERPGEYPDGRAL